MNLVLEILFELYLFNINENSGTNIIKTIGILINIPINKAVPFPKWTYESNKSKAKSVK